MRTKITYVSMIAFSAVCVYAHAQGPLLTVSPAPLIFYGFVGEASPSSQTFTVGSTTQGAGSVGSLNWTASAPIYVYEGGSSDPVVPGYQWLTPLAKTTGTTPSQLTVSVNIALPPAGRVSGPLPAGTYEASFTFNAPSAPLISLSVILFVFSRTPTTGGSVVNGASFVAGADLAQGSLVSLFGVNFASQLTSASQLPLPVDLAGVSVVLRDLGTAMSPPFYPDMPAPLVVVTPTQINFQIPWGISITHTWGVVVSVAGAARPAQTINLVSAWPGIFSINASGAGQGAIQIANSATFAAPASSISGAQSRPALQGESITIYATGLGGVSNQPGSGAAALGGPTLSLTSQPCYVTIGGITSLVSFCGLVPGYVGLYQVNVTVPSDAPVGSTVPVLLVAGGNASNIVTMAVQQ